MALHIPFPRLPSNGLAVIDKLKYLLSYFYQHLFVIKLGLRLGDNGGQNGIQSHQRAPIT
jgi:hypothetical protein